MEASDSKVAQCYAELQVAQNQAVPDPDAIKRLKQEFETAFSERHLLRTASPRLDDPKDCETLEIRRDL